MYSGGEGIAGTPLLQIKRLELTEDLEPLKADDTERGKVAIKNIILTGYGNPAPSLPVNGEGGSYLPVYRGEYGGKIS